MANRDPYPRDDDLRGYYRGHPHQVGVKIGPPPAETESADESVRMMPALSVHGRRS